MNKATFKKISRTLTIRTFKLSEDVYITVGWHVGRSCWCGEIYVFAKPLLAENGRPSPRDQSRQFFEKDRKLLFANMRLALSQGLQDINWDRAMMKRLTK